MNDEETRRLEELWTRFVAREPLAAAERAELALALGRDDVLRRRMVQDLQFDGALRAAGEIERGQEKIVATVRALANAATHTEKVVAAVRSRLEAKVAARAGAGDGDGRHLAPLVPGRRARSARLLVAATVVLAGSVAALVLLRPRLGPTAAPSPQLADEGHARVRGPAWRNLNGDDAPATRARPPERAATAVIGHVETVAGTVYRQAADGTRRAATVLDLGAGDWVWTSGVGARARMTDAQGNRIEIEGDAVAGLSADVAQPNVTRFFLAHGRATGFVSATPTGPGLILSSPHAIVSGAGTVRLDVAAANTRVDVKEGRARVSALGVQRSAEVESGQYALVSGDDLQAPRASDAPREALLLTGPDDTKEGPAPAEGLRISEQRLKARLERLGFVVNVVEALALPPERARSAALLVLSSSVSSQLLEPWVSGLPVPLLVLESTAFEQLGLTGGRWRHDTGPVAPLTEIIISKPDHPLAAGLSGTVRVLTVPERLRWASPPPGASVIATYAGAPDQASVLFGYERGASTASGPAPARRVGLFLGNGRVIRGLTAEGWRLFDAAVLWAAGI